MPRILLSSLVLVLIVAIAAPAWAAESIDWSETPPESGSLVGSEAEVSGPGTFRLVTLEGPQVVNDQYEVAGTVRYVDVEGEAYLEMWSIFADGEAYFSRTLAIDGPTGLISGTEPGRDFVLPFSLNGSAGPSRIEINVVLPGQGTVWIGPLAFEGIGDSSAWWSERASSVVGASLGIAAGLTGAAIGMLSGRKRGHRAVMVLLLAGLVAGTVALLAGGAALAFSQPRHVWYPLVLVGLILVIVDGSLLPIMRKARAASELQRMRALDAA